MSISNDQEREGQAKYPVLQPGSDIDAVQAGHIAAAFLAAIVESSDDAIVSKTLNGIITTWNKGAERLFGYAADEAVGKPITIVIPPDRLDEEPAILARIQAGERVDHFETIRRRKDGSLIDISLTISPIRDGNGMIIGASKIARDISERKRAAEHQELLLREMHHRVKNLFAITGSIITLAARTAKTTAELAAGMQDRLVALSLAHEMTLPSPNGEATGAPQTTLFRLLSNILAPYERDGANRWQLTGDDIDVSGNKITDLALLFHEFATNAAKYGALSVEEGKLDIAVTKNGNIVEIVWLESNGPRHEPPETHSIGFGSRLEQIVGKGLGVDISREWMPNGLAIRLSVPIGAISD
ncbi:PAS domain S-box protein [Rhizobium leguminosarum]|uniref:PAS domain S-box protein n=1 Tax=Rhizobium leguminosarum TaxID=384 RepID=UPI001C9395B3|nr:PAS domain S-box protein [Rhizobium leguminosarum]MBY5466357.1 PAS domain S-box protein [Rhizobium leguminosarum]MBY5530889.1 PAS domain S-box protein [Rhizobium leguminosarum]